MYQHQKHVLQQGQKQDVIKFKTNPMLKKTITQLFILTIVISCIFLANGLILAWTSPGYNPPDGNVDAPLNIGSDSQYKLGALGVEGIFRGYSNAIFDGNVGIGITNPGAKLEVEGNIIADEPTQNGHVATKFYVDRIVTQFECTSGAVSKINLLTGAVECRDVAGVTSPDYLVYNQHTTNACTS